MVEIRSKDDLQRWLEGKPLYWAGQISFRASTRGLPVFGTHIGIFRPDMQHKWKGRFAIGLFRALTAKKILTGEYGVSPFSEIFDYVRNAIGLAKAVVIHWRAAYKFLESINDSILAYISSVDLMDEETAIGDLNISIVLLGGPNLEEQWRTISLDATALESGVDLWSQPLWLDDIPEWAAEGWENLATELTKRTPYWKTLVRWYEDRLRGDDWAASQGRPAIRELEIARASLPDSYWKKGGKAVNLAIAELEDFFWNNVPLKDPALRELVNGIGVITDNDDVVPGIEDDILPPMPDLPPPELPAQSHGAHFGIRDGLIAFAPADHLDPSRNNIQRLKSLHPLLLAEARSAISIFGRNQAHGRIHDTLLIYARWLDGEVTALDFDVLCGLGTKLQSEEAAAKEAIEDGLEPPFERSEIAALKSLLDLHGPFVLATEIGQQFVADAERWQRNPQEEAAFRQTATDFAEAVEAEGIATPETAAFVKQAAVSAGTGPQPERSAMFSMGTVRNVGIAIVAAGGIYKAGAAVFSTAIGAWVAAVIIADGIKKSDIGLGASGYVTDLLNDVTRGTALKRFYDFALRNEDKLRALAGNRREFAFLHVWLDWLKSRGEPK